MVLTRSASRVTAPIIDGTASSWAAVVTGAVDVSGPSGNRRVDPIVAGALPSGSTHASQQQQPEQTSPSCSPCVNTPLTLSPSSSHHGAAAAATAPRRSQRTQVARATRATTQRNARTPSTRILKVTSPSDSSRSITPVSLSLSPSSATAAAQPVLSAPPSPPSPTLQETRDSENADDDNTVIPPTPHTPLSALSAVQTEHAVRSPDQAVREGIAHQQPSALRAEPAGVRVHRLSGRDQHCAYLAVAKALGGWTVNASIRADCMHTGFH